MRRTGWSQAKDLSDRMEWKHSEEAKILTWTVKALDRSILPWACVFAIPIAIPIILIIVLWVKGDTYMAKAMIAPLLFILFIFYKVAVEKTVFVYRATPQRLEICQWQDIPDLVFTFLRVVPFFVIGIILMALISNPALSIAALAGPALVGILIASVGGDSNYKTIYKRFRQRDFEWKNVDRAMLDVKKGLLALSISSPNNVIHDHEIDFDNPGDHRYLTRIYFDKGQEEAVLQLFKERMLGRGTTVERSYKYDFSG